VGPAQTTVSPQTEMETKPTGEIGAANGTRTRDFPFCVF
jgi:hypothetical protein